MRPRKEGLAGFIQGVKLKARIKEETLTSVGKLVNGKRTTVESLNGKTKPINLTGQM